MPARKKRQSRKRSGRKYSTKAQKKVAKVMREYKRGRLKGGKGRHPRVMSRKQAIAIGLSEARRAGAKVPPPPKRRKKKSSKKRR